MDRYLKFATDLAAEAGDIMLKYFKVGVDRTIKSDNTPVTIADTAINELVINSVNKKFPDHSILGEEISDIKEGSEYTWVCDPIDGTTPFTQGIPTNIFSLALTRNGQSLVGVAFDPYLKRMYAASLGKGSYMNGQPIKVDPNLNLEHASVSFPSPRCELLDSGRLFTAAMQYEMRNASVGSTVYEGMLVASGQILAQIFPARTAHDIAAVKIIVEEAGGKVTDLAGNEQRYDQEINGAVVSNGSRHNELLELIRPHLYKN